MSSRLYVNKHKTRTLAWAHARRASFELRLPDAQAHITTRRANSSVVNAPAEVSSVRRPASHHSRIARTRGDVPFSHIYYICVRACVCVL